MVMPQQNVTTDKRPFIPDYFEISLFVLALGGDATDLPFPGNLLLRERARNKIEEKGERYIKRKVEQYKTDVDELIQKTMTREPSWNENHWKVKQWETKRKRKENLPGIKTLNKSKSVSSKKPLHGAHHT